MSAQWNWQPLDEEDDDGSAYPPEPPPYPQPEAYVQGYVPVPDGEEGPPAPLQVQVVDPHNQPAHPAGPRGFAPGQFQLMDMGSRYSNVIQVDPTGSTARLGSFGKAQAEAMIGLATVHISVKELGLFPAGVPDSTPDQRLIITAYWQSGRAGGGVGAAGAGAFDAVEIDATNGAVFTVPGTTQVGLDAELRTSTPGHGISLQVEATVHWGTSVSSKPARNSANQITLPFTGGAPVPQGPFRIPARASTVTLMADSTINLAQTEIRFQRGSTVFSPTLYVYTAPDPTKPIPIVAGARFFFIAYLGALTNVIPVYDLSL